MPQLPIRRWCKDLGERGLPGSRNIATAWGNKLTHIVCISSISSSSTPANWSSGIFIWNREECLEKRDGGSKSLPYSPPYHWLQQSVGKSLKQTAFPVFRHAHQTSKLSKGCTNDHSPLHPGSAAAFSEPLFTLLTRDQDVYMRTVGGASSVTLTKCLKESQVTEKHENQHGELLSMTPALCGGCCQWWSWREILMWLTFSSSPKHHLSGCNFIFCKFFPWVGRQNGIDGHSPHNAEGYPIEESTLTKGLGDADSNPPQDEGLRFAGVRLS